MKKTLLILFFLFTASYSFGQNKWSIQLSTLTGGFSQRLNGASYAQNEGYSSPALSYSVQLSGYYNLYKGLKVGAGLGYLVNRSEYNLVLSHIDDPFWPGEF